MHLIVSQSLAAFAAVCFTLISVSAIVVVPPPSAITTIPVLA